VKYWILSALWIGGLAHQSAFAAVQVKDDLGRRVTLAQPAKRIISLAPHLTEDLFAIGAGGQLVGVVSYSDYPKAALKIPLVGGYTGVDLEKIRALRPDLIVAWQSGNPPAQLHKIAALGIPMFYDNSQTLKDVPTVLERLGVLTGQADGATAAAQQFRGRLAQLEKQYANKRPVRTFYQVWDRPLMTINRHQIISDAMRICGAVNVFAEANSLVPTVDDEAVVVKNPELMLTSGDSTAKNSWLDRWKRWPHLAAVKHGQLVMLPPDLLSRMGPRLVDGTAALCRAVNQARQAPP
jgi:iron complex transport system substrate-binding protein